MGVPTSEVGYIPAMPRREDHEVHKDMWWHWTKKKSPNDPSTLGAVPIRRKDSLGYGQVKTGVCEPV